MCEVTQTTYCFFLSSELKEKEHAILQYTLKLKHKPELWQFKL